MVLTVEDSLSRPVSKIAIAAEADVRPYTDNLVLRLGTDIEVHSDRFNQSYIQVVGRGTSKEAGTSRALQLVSPTGTLSEALVFGDDLSDLGIIRAARYGVAMGNGRPKVRELAPYSTLSNDDDGVAVVLEVLLATWS